MIICLCLVEFNVILRYEMKNKWWVLFSCSSNKYFNFFKIFLKRYQVSFLVWGIKKINNMAIKSKRKEKKNHKDKYLVGFKNIKIKNNCLFCWSNCTLIFFLNTGIQFDYFPRLSFYSNITSTLIKHKIQIETNGILLLYATLYISLIQ